MTKERVFTVRFAPSPTGEFHIGSLGMVLADYMLARTNKGRCLLRIEDTDQKREVEGAAERLINSIHKCGIVFDEPPIFQSQRKEIYNKFAQQLLESGKAYKDDGAVRIRFADAVGRVTWTDLVKGKMSLPVCDRDAVIVKSNGLPPYNLAHIVDDYMTGVTHVVRGEEWLPSTAEHIQIIEALGFPKTEYAHMPVICIMDNGNKRKLSKRKDKEALVENFIAEGYPIQALIEYLLTIYNTDYELWRTANPKTDWREFPFRFEKIGSNSPLFDWDKLNSISSNIIANMSCEEINAEVKKFYGDKITAEQYEKIFELLAVDRGTERPRKDIAKFGSVMTEFDYVFRPVKMSPLLERYIVLFKSLKNKDEWFPTVKEKAVEFGFKNVREFTQALRVELTGRERSTDLYTISKVLLG